MMEFEERLAQIETAVRQGRMTEARGLLRAVPRSQVPRPFAARCAHLARRCGDYGYALRLLNPIVRAEKILGEPPTADEWCAYAATLVMIGAAEEANRIFAEIDPKHHPEVLLFKSMALIGQWKYGSTIPLLERYLRIIPPAEYFHWVAATNYAAALVVQERYEAADALLEKLRRTCEAENHILLLSNTMVLTAQSALNQGDFPRARDVLRKGHELIATGALYRSLAEKWLVIIDLKESGASPEAVAAALKLRRFSVEHGFWENVRDLDFHLAKARNDTKSFYDVYLGSPYASYRRKIKREFKPKVGPPGQILLSAKEGQPERKVVLDDFLNSGRTSSRLALALLSDHYQPVRLGQLFSLLHPGEFYSPFSSPHRIEQSVYRLRQAAAEAALGFSIMVKGGGFKLSPDPGVGLELSTEFLNRFPGAGAPPWMKSLKPRFTPRDLASATGVSLRTAQRMINEAVNDKHLVKQGRGRATVYLATRGISHD